jgi:hypothetical protein
MILNKKKDENNLYLEHGLQHIGIIFNHYHQKKIYHVQFHLYLLHLNHLLFQYE